MRIHAFRCYPFWLYVTLVVDVVVSRNDHRGCSFRMVNIKEKNCTHPRSANAARRTRAEPCCLNQLGLLCVHERSQTGANVSKKSPPFLSVCSRRLGSHTNRMKSTTTTNNNACLYCRRTQILPTRFAACVVVVVGVKSGG